MSLCLEAMGALAINTSAKPVEALPRSPIRNQMHFYIGTEIFMLSVKYSCVPVCKLVAEGKVHRESKGIQYARQTTFSVVLMLLAYRTLEGGFNDLPRQDKQQPGNSLLAPFCCLNTVRWPITD